MWILFPSHDLEGKYTFTLGSTPSITEEAGGPTVSAGPVTITP